MAETLRLQIVTPEREIFSQDVAEVVFPSVNGMLGVLPGHAPLMAVLDIGELQFRVPGENRRHAAVCGGFAEVLRDGVKILANTCELAEEIDKERAELSRKRGERERKDASRMNSVDYRMADFRVKKAVNRLRIAGQG